MDLSVTGNTVLGNAATDTIQFQGKIDGDIISEASGNTIGDDTNPWEIIANTVKANLTTGVDNSVVIKDADGFLKTDEIDSRVWGSSLVDGSGTNTYVAYWTDANTVSGESTFAYNATTNILSVTEVSSTNLTFSGTINGGSTGTIEEVDTITTRVLNAEEKNFDIPHPTKEGWRLRHSVMEGPERGVYIRGKITKVMVLSQLPEYWKGFSIRR